MKPSHAFALGVVLLGALVTHAAAGGGVLGPGRGPGAGGGLRHARLLIKTIAVKPLTPAEEREHEKLDEEFRSKYSAHVASPSFADAVYVPGVDDQGATSRRSVIPGDSVVDYDVAGTVTNDVCALRKQGSDSDSESESSPLGSDADVDSGTEANRAEMGRSCGLAALTKGFVVHTSGSECDDPTVRASDEYSKEYYDEHNSRMVLRVKFHVLDQEAHLDRILGAIRESVAVANKVLEVAHSMRVDASINLYTTPKALRKQYYVYDILSSGEDACDAVTADRLGYEAVERVKRGRCTPMSVWARVLREAESRDDPYHPSAVNVYVGWSIQGAAMLGFTKGVGSLPTLSFAGNMFLNSRALLSVGEDVVAKWELRHTFVHELGHVAGLFHTFQGTGLACPTKTCVAKENPGLCYERTPSKYTGDLCEDTPPSHRDTGCASQKPPNNIDKCGGAHQYTWYNKQEGLVPDETNVMSYRKCAFDKGRALNDFGKDPEGQYFQYYKRFDLAATPLVFSKCQAQRMRCWLSRSEVLVKARTVEELPKEDGDDFFE